MTALVSIHSVFRWILLGILGGLAAMALLRLARKSGWSDADEQPFVMGAVLLDVQVLLGVVLWLLGDAKSTSAFFAVVHPGLMISAAVVLHLAIRKARELSDAATSYQWLFGGVVGALVLAIVGIPWGR